jgi:predicted O-methyltransferase YrrM
MRKNDIFRFILCLVSVGIILSGRLDAQNLKENPALDEKVKKFLADHAGQWHDLNISASDGQLLYDIIIKGKYKYALEIGTSTGCSGIYIAWALSKTGGKLTTVEIDESRHKTALANFKEAGLSDYIDAKLADAHAFVKEVKGPFDFVFSDADKNWYKNYFNEVDPKLKVGGCYATHNISGSSSGSYGGRGGDGGSGDYYDYVKSLKNYESTLNSGNRGGGLLVSYKRSEK